MPDAPSDAATRIAAGYAFDGAALEFGAVILDGEAHPDARIRVPLVDAQPARPDRRARPAPARPRRCNC